MRGTAPIVTSVALLATVVAIASPATASLAATTESTAAAHLPHFDLISGPTSFKRIPRILRLPFEDGLPKGARHGFRVGKVRRIGDLLATARGKGACGVGAARHAFAAFLEAFDQGDVRRLDSLFARRPAFKWFSAGAPGPPRFDRAARRRDTLIPYLRALHRRRYRLGLDWLRVNSGAHRSTGLAFELRGSMPGFRNGKWFPLAGKADLFCLAGGPKFRVFSLGPPGSGAAAEMSHRP